ncbi:FadR family transcriptional regulator [Mangrovimicrobium sediminis]|uniref:FadR family transcriptional regulator n=1 Tax=Mangrovimicrobium sediminis TaxID=2562682 RepID=A0A4Z0LWS6_9GAMM|nr:FadR/GntR family transcriptional regulator [Haliea sp. SAOS-164]TGD71729.1 FadR family transcriptional regulator [Haliea sp. SAOS-164]
MQIEAVKVRRLYLEVASQIEKLIRSGEIQPGDRLPSERNLATSFKVSRPTIREAMIALEIAGLVEIRTGSGIYVIDKGQPDKGLVDEGPGPFEVLESRMVVEAEIAALAAARISDEQVDELEAALREMEREDAEGSVTERADHSFHCVIAAASGNSALASVVEWLWDLRNNSQISTLFHQRVREKGVHPSLDDHRRIFNAMRARDPLRAREAMRAHIANAIDTDIALLEAEKDT